jgi:uncharacterized protein (TIGR02118 family)
VVKAIALWSQPRDPDIFEQEYFDRHIPLARSIGVPGMRALLTARAVGDDAPYYRVAELVFDDADSLSKGLESPQMATVLEDAGRLQSDHGVTVTLLVVDQESESEPRP